MREIMRLISKMETDPGYSEGEMTMDSIQIISDLPPGAIDELHPRDITTMGDITAPFLEAVMGGGGSPAILAVWYCENEAEITANISHFLSVPWSEVADLDIVTIFEMHRQAVRIASIYQGRL